MALESRQADARQDALGDSRLPRTQATVPRPGQVVSPASQKPGTPMSCGTACWLLLASVWRTPPTAPRGRRVKRS